MRTRTALALVAVVSLLLAGGAYGLLATDPGGASLRATWTSDTGRDVGGNHHGVVAGRIDGETLVYAPISDRAGTEGCRLVALDGETGETRWNYTIDPADCTIHSVADPSLADLDGDGRPLVFAATTENAVYGFDPASGEIVFDHDLPAYGYSKPVVADLVPGGERELIVADVKGTVFVLRPDGSEVWNRSLAGYAWAQPTVADFDADGAPELAVGLGNGRVVVLDRNGSVALNVSAPLDGGVNWMTTGRADEDRPVEIVAATEEGQVVALDGATGEVQWRQRFASFAAVHAFGDGDGDGEAEIYAVADDGKLRSLRASDGRVEWTTTLTLERVQMMPPPVLADLDGDGDPELGAVTNDGLVSVVDPATGEVLATHERDVPIYEHATAFDVDGDGSEELLVMYADGRVVRLDYE